MLQTDEDQQLIGSMFYKYLSKADQQNALGKLSKPYLIPSVESEERRSQLIDASFDVSKTFYKYLSEEDQRNAVLKFHAKRESQSSASSSFSGNTYNVESSGEDEDCPVYEGSIESVDEFVYTSDASKCTPAATIVVEQPKGGCEKGVIVCECFLRKNDDEGQRLSSHKEPIVTESIAFCHYEPKPVRKSEHVLDETFSIIVDRVGENSNDENEDEVLSEHSGSIRDEMSRSDISDKPSAEADLNKVQLEEQEGDEQNAEQTANATDVVIKENVSLSTRENSRPSSGLSPQKLESILRKTSAIEERKQSRVDLNKIQNLENTETNQKDNPNVATKEQVTYDSENVYIETVTLLRQPSNKIVEATKSPVCKKKTSAPKKQNDDKFTISVYTVVTLINDLNALRKRSTISVYDLNFHVSSTSSSASSDIGAHSSVLLARSEWFRCAYIKFMNAEPKNDYSHFAREQPDYANQLTIRKCSLPKQQNPTKVLINLELRAISHRAFNTFIRFLYTADLEIKLENAISLLECADVFKIKNLTQGINEFLLQNIQNYSISCTFHALRLAHKLKLLQLKQECIKIIRKQKQIVVYTQDWHELLTLKPKLTAEIMDF